MAIPEDVWKLAKEAAGNVSAPDMPDDVDVMAVARAILADRASDVRLANARREGMADCLEALAKLRGVLDDQHDNFADLYVDDLCRWMRLMDAAAIRKAKDTGSALEAKGGGK
jgi:hypothetical protein